MNQSAAVIPPGGIDRDVIPATVSASHLDRSAWEAVVIGAGPAGSIAAFELARCGVRVLLIDRQSFPRDKVCGGCLNGQALSILESSGLTERLAHLNGPALSGFRLAAGRRQVSIPLTAGIAVSRAAFDAMLVRAAIDAGAGFLPNAQAHSEGVSGNSRDIRIEVGKQQIRVSASAVVIATGLSARSLAGEDSPRLREARNSRIGISITTPDFPGSYTPGTIYMAVGQTGYVGLTVIEDERLNIAAAVDRQALRASDPASVCCQILESAGLPADSRLLERHWTGTVGLTRRGGRAFAERLFVVGDAAGYIEPFTGQGMAWALSGGRSVVPFVQRALSGWKREVGQDWGRVWKRTVRRRQRLCRVLAVTLRRPLLVSTAICALQAMPSLGSPIVAQLNRPEAVSV